jgi:hypothetical protein
MNEHIASVASVVRKLLSNPAGLPLTVVMLWTLVRSRDAVRRLVATDDRDVIGLADARPVQPRSTEPVRKASVVPSDVFQDQRARAIAVRARLGSER